MHLRTSTGDVSRHSISNALSSTSHVSGPDDIESLGDVYIWGEVWIDVISPDGNNKYICSKADVSLPKILDANVVIDVNQIACGFRHAALVTRQGEVFTWGEECGGRLGHGTDIDISRPRLVESLALSTVSNVSCGEFHTCAVTTTGDLFSWGDGAYKSGILGHGGEACHWLPNRVFGPLEGIQASTVACGTWHTALITSDGRMFTFGDGSFGVLGHGDRENVAYPKEIQSLNGLRTLRVVCGVWHTAAIIEVMGSSYAGANVSSQKLFTWGDGDGYRLGHGDKEARLTPSCVASLIDYNFHQLACGHDITVALSTSGHVFTMGSSMHGQLGNPQFDGKVPCLVQDRLACEIVEEIACGSHHVVALTSHNEVYTWGRGVNGRLGHGDTDDRKTPMLVEALKDRHVKSISCGSNFTACICIRKWVSNTDQTVCTGCRLAFGFTRKRHDCYNCGLVFCHACSSRKVLKAALAPTQGKPHRVCDSCYSKLRAAETGMSSITCRKNVVSRRSVDAKQKLERKKVRQSRRLFATMELRDFYDVRYGKNRLIPYQTSQVSSRSQPKDTAISSSLSLIQTASRPAMMPTASRPPIAAIPRFSTPYSWKSNFPSPASSDFSGSLMEIIKKTNENWVRDVAKLQEEIRSLKQKLEQKDVVANKAAKEAKEAAFTAAQESAKFNVAVELIRTIEAQMKDLSGELPDDQSDNLNSIITSAESFLKNNKTQALKLPSSDLEHSTKANDQNNIISNINDIREEAPIMSTNSRGEVQLTEQFDLGVYVTVLQQLDGTMLFKRVKFSRRKFSEQQAEEWWRNNKERMFQKYSFTTQTSSIAPSTSTQKEEGSSFSKSN